MNHNLFVAKNFLYEGVMFDVMIVLYFTVNASVQKEWFGKSHPNGALKSFEVSI